MRILPALLLAASLLGACGGEPAPVPPWRGEGNLIEVTVHDLHCDGCEVNVEGELALVEGVESVTADHETDLVLVILEAEADRVQSIPVIRNAIHEAGMLIVGEDAIPTR